MLVSIILSFLMSIVIFFFVVMTQNFSVTSIVYAAFLLFLFARMTFSESKIKGSGVIYRRIFQILFALFFTFSFIARLIDERGSMEITAAASAASEIPFCHIAIPQVFLPFLLAKEIIFPARITGHFASIASMLGIWFVTTILLGRGWCSWVCFYGGWEEGFSHIGKKRRLNLLSHNKEIREFQFGFLAFIALASLGLFSSVYCAWFCPFKTVTEYSPFNSVPNIVGGCVFISLFIALVVVLPILTKRRTQCSSLCPFGAFASLTDGLSLFRIKIDTEKCKGCLKCAAACPFGAIDISTIKDKKGKPELTCSKCGECVKVCSEKAISYSFRFEKICGHPEPRTAFGRGIQAFLDPANLFRFAAFSFGAAMSGSFVVDSLNRIVGFVQGLL